MGSYHSPMRIALFALLPCVSEAVGSSYHSHSPHGHNPHSHAPHTHAPHTHAPHSHSPAPVHTHTPHTHSPHSHTPHVHAPPPIPPAAPPVSPIITHRFLFADGISGAWAHFPEQTATYSDPLHCAVGGVVYFHWYSPNHNVVRMASATHLANCDFSGATTLVPVGSAGTGTAEYYLPCATAGENIYLSCSVSNHCASGQKLTVEVSDSTHVFDSNGEKLIHVRRAGT